MTPEQVVADAITFLFVPGDRPERFAKAASSTADVVIIDLEDAVAPGAGKDALQNTIAALSDTGGLNAMVRVQSVGGDLSCEQLDALSSVVAESGHGLMGVVLAKADDAAALLSLRERLPKELALVPLVESAIGLVAAGDMARIPGVTRLAFGAIDFSLDIGADPIDEFMSFARSHLVVASRASGIAAPLDSPSIEIERADLVEASARRARGYGFGGMLCIHPAQLAAIRNGFAPTKAEAEWARAVLAAEGGAVQVDGRMVDRPITERAKQILRRLLQHPQ